MKFSKPVKFACCVGLSVMMSNVSALAATQSLASSGMISTNELVQEFDRAKAMKDVEEFLGRDDVKRALTEQGVDAKEAASRLAALSQAELRELSGQVAQARAGGDILIVILVVVLIIFLVKRI